MTELNAELASQQCGNPSAADNPALTPVEASAYLPQLDPKWHIIENRAISFSYTFNNYYQTIAFVNVIAQIAHQQNHHPDLQVSYNRCTVTYSTHSVGGLSVNDFICAAKINAAQML